MLPPSLFYGYSLAVLRTGINRDELVRPACSLSYHIPRKHLDTHFSDHLLDATFWKHGWNDEGQVVGVWAEVPRPASADEDSEDDPVLVRIDLGDIAGSALYKLVL